ncbi:Fe(3+)-siderophore ABC transporter permease [Rhodobacter sp. TJ_12]|uniref:FecCD family ABC transporter permease n=1 Tax=Rhodobacter sp. TJ_12 TaxID=2029399 RepID=UPI001CBC97B0|nr:iron ABC transporter permease [Rhodobacter sp. TJ_12]MBZ4023720.1 Fe(3+)-siderophore ABC transporter permease [Rhodobacter sp. TJ_12]
MQSPLARPRLLLWVALLFVLCTTLASPFIGPRDIEVQVTLAAFSAFDPGDGAHLLVREQRLPRALLALVVGAALGAAGTLMQTLTRNPLADPGLLGISAGATLMIVCQIVVLGYVGVTAALWAGILGAALGGAAVFGLGGLARGHDPVRLVLAGAALSIVLMTLTRVITVNAEAPVFDQFRHWAVGSLQGRGWAVLGPTAGIVAVGTVVALGLTRPLDALALGQEFGQSLGADPRRILFASAAMIVALGGAATAAAGPISFVGLAAPHLARPIAGPAHRPLLLASMLTGAALVGFADLAGRVIGAPGQIDVGIMAGLIGGGIFIALARRLRMGGL